MAGTESQRVKLVAIDDDPVALELITEALSAEDLEILTATRPADGLELVRTKHPEIVLLDLIMPEMNGMELLDRIVAAWPATDVILITGHYSTESAVEAIRKGASDYLTKPLSIATLRERAGKFIMEARRRRRASQLDSEVLETSRFEGMVGRSPLMLEMFDRIRRVAPHYRTALIIGETGTGKELVANALHRLSPAASGRLVACNCSAIVETLFESELFGHVKGAFTGATQDKAGFLQYASGGTLFLDEIGDMPVTTQSKLLRALETREFMRVGSPAVFKVDVRVIAATHRDLHERIAKGQFREDLFYRLSMVEIRVPRLADRKEDLPYLERYYMDKFSKEYGRVIRGITPRAQIMLSRYSWPGNVRELENVLGQACMITQAETIDVRDLPESIKSHRQSEQNTDDEPRSLEDVHRMHVHRVLERVAGNKTEAARILGINRATLYRLLRKSGGEKEAAGPEES
jgi:DNA-binding NtrC family response regulator